MSDLSQRAMVVRVKMSGWSANKKDRDETENVRARNHVAQGAVRVSKSLLPGADKLDNIRATGAELMKYVRKHSLPWDRGSYIIQAEKCMPFMEQVNKHKARWEHSVDDFIREYPALIEKAKQDLGPLFNEADYPEDVSDRFSCKVSYHPIQSGDDWRVTLADDDIKILKESTEAAVKEQLGDAMKDVWRRLHDCVSHACKKLSDPEAVFHDTLVENAQELVDILPSLNFTNDPDLDRMGETIKDLLACQDPKELRKNKDYRKHVAGDLMKTQKSLEDYMGLFKN